MDFWQEEVYGFNMSAMREAGKKKKRKEESVTQTEATFPLFCQHALSEPSPRSSLGAGQVLTDSCELLRLDLYRARPEEVPTSSAFDLKARSAATRTRHDKRVGGVFPCPFSPSPPPPPAFSLL